MAREKRCKTLLTRSDGFRGLSRVMQERIGVFHESTCSSVCGTLQDRCNVEEMCRKVQI